MEEKLDIVFRFVFAISNEYKNHTITYKNRNEIDKYGNFDFGTIDFLRSIKTDNKIDVDEKSAAEVFIEKYYTNRSDFKFFESIYSYITGANSLIRLYS